MSPVPPTDVETAPPFTTEGNAGASVEKSTVVPEATPVGTPAATAETVDGVPTTPAPTKVGAYKNRGIRSKHSPLDIAPLLLRILTAIFTLIAFAVIASDSMTVFEAVGIFVTSFSFHFNDFFYFSYLLTANVIAFTYAIVTILLSLLLLSERFVSRAVIFSIFALDLILSYLLMSASTSAATGIRIDRSSGILSGSFLSKAYAAIAFSFLAFFALAAAALLSGFRAARHRRAV